MLPILQIGPVALRTSGLLILAGIYLGLSLAERRLPKDGLSPNHLYNLVFSVFISWILAGRLSYILQNFPLFRRSPLNILSLDMSLFDPFAGIVVASIVALVYGQRKKLAFWKILDAFTPAMAVLAVFLALAHIASGFAYGAVTAVPWAINMWGAMRHPSQVYETLAALSVLIILWRQFGKSPFPGSTFLRFIIMSAGFRLLLEAWRGDSVLALGGLRIPQMLAWVFMFVGIWLYETYRVGYGKQPL